MEGRVKHSVNNIIFSVIEQVVRILLNFVTRTVFIKVLEDSLLGVNGLFTDILSLLSIAELGFGTAIIYGMYKPLADKDERKIAALMNYYKKIYNFLALIIAVFGLALVPFLKYLVNLENPIDNLTLYYLIFLADTVCSYLLANRTAIIEADQNYHLIKKYNTCFIVLKCILQILSLIIFKSFILYLLIQVLTTFGANLYGAIIAKKKYPYAFYNVKLDKKEKKSLIENVKALFVYKIGNVLINHTDNIIMSIICGTVNVGYYSNYNMIVFSINRFLNIVFNSIKASVGNLNAENNQERKIKIFYNLDFFANWLYGFIAVALWLLLNDFMMIWIGTKYTFDKYVVFAIVLIFYIMGMNSLILTYRDTTGIFRETKYIYLTGSILNVFLSIVLGKIYGVFGILIATSISRLLTSTWFDPYTLFKSFFKVSSKKYFCNKIKNIFIILFNIVLLTLIFNYLKLLSLSLLQIFILKVIITVILANFVFWIFYRNTEEYKYYKTIFVSFITRKKVSERRRVDER